MKTAQKLTTAALAGLLAVALAASAGQATGAGKPSAKKRAAVLEAIVGCRTITDSDARLKCFDEASAKLDEAEAAGQVVVVDREQARQVRREVFGLQLPSLDIFNLGGGGKAAGAAAADDVEQVADTVRSAGRTGDGKWVFELTGGPVWRQMDDGQFAIDPHAGSKVVIKRGALGAFFMKVDGQPAVRVHRDR